MLKVKLLPSLLIALIALVSGHRSWSQSPWKLVWADEFNYRGLPDSAKWGYDTGGNGWGNRELEYYTDHDTANARVDNGYLYLTARKQQKDNNGYTSARLVTKGKGDWRYGRIEVRAKLPAGRGMWPAIWMLPTNWVYGGWPASGEIDIMENVGFMPDSIFGSVHTKSFNHVIRTQFTKGIFVKKPYTSFHTYSVEWDSTTVSFFLDGKSYAIFHNTGKGFAEWPFDQSFHLLLNIAVGGGWGGAKGVDTTIFPRTMVVDYVRIYQRNPS